MCSIDIFAVIIILLLVLVVLAKIRQVDKKEEFEVKDYRPKAYLIYSSDPAKCEDCFDLADRFLLTVGRKDRYLSHIWDVELPNSKAAAQRLVAEHNLQIRTLPSLVVINDDKVVDMHEGTQLVRLMINDMV
jgi:hypothetical protein